MSTPRGGSMQWVPALDASGSAIGPDHPYTLEDLAGMERGWNSRFVATVKELARVRGELKAAQERLEARETAESHDAVTRLLEEDR